MTEPSDSLPPHPAGGSLPASAAIAEDGLPATLGPYRFEDRLGRGGMGVVYSAWDERLRRRVALKQVLPERASRPRARGRFLREARAAAQLSHPNIVHVYDILETPAGDWIVMELVPGRPLRRLIESGSLTLDRTVALAEQVAGGLAAAHALGIVHRDLKSENVLVTPEDRAKILDFGLAKHRSPSAPDPTLSVDGQLLGTVRAMSPEQAGGLELDGRSDLFSFGTLLYEALTGDSPFLAANDFLTMNRVCVHRQVPVHERVREVPRELSLLVDSLLEKNPEDRPGSAAEVAAALARIGRSLEGAPPGAGAGRRHPPSALENEAAPTAKMLDLRATAPTEDRRRRRSVERRQVTVLCASLVSAAGEASATAPARTPSSTSLDPEVLFDVLPDFGALAEAAVQRFDGHVESASGHRLVACFGYPRAHEDDARRAVLAALELTSEVERLAAEHGSEVLSLRVGIHTGSAVASALRGQQPQVILGETLDLAHAVESQAPPNGILVSASTLPLVAGLFRLEAREPVRLLAGGEPVVLHRVRARLPDDGRSAAGELPPMVARERELGLLLECWERTLQGCGQMVLVSGDAGIGKSRLVQALAEHLGATSQRWLTAYGSPYASSSPFHLVGALLRQAAGLDPEAPPGRQRRRLEQVLTEHGLEAGRLAGVLAPLASLPPAAGDAELPPEKSRELLLDAVPALLLALAERRPTALLIEDLHWVDPSTLELLGVLIDRLAAVPVLLLMTFRRDFEAPWGHRSGSSQLTLERLDEAQVSRLIERVTGGRELPPAVRRQIVAKTDGVPLFVEELTKTVLASDLLVDAGEGFELARPLGELAIPATLKDSLEARLDRLGSAREVAQVAAACGREVSFDLLAAVCGTPAAPLARELDRLVRAELLLRRGVSEPARYVFKHALLRDAAYDSLLRRQRREIHGRIAEALAGRFEETAASRPELLAHHYSQARQLNRAVDCWRQAGELAFRRSASVEAAAHLRSGLELLADLPAGVERDGRELGLRMLLGSALASSGGYGSPAVSAAFDRAFELCGRLPDSPDLFWVIWGLFRFHLARASFARTGELTERLRRLAAAQDEATPRMAASWASGFSRFFTGDLRAAREDMERVLAGESPERGRRDVLFAGEDFGVNAATFEPVILWYLGHPDQARARGEAGLERARRAGHPLSLCLGLNHDVLLHLLRRDPAKVIERAEELLALAGEIGAWWQAWAEMYLGWAHAMRADSGAAAPSSDSSSETDWELEQIESGLAGFRAGGSRLFEPHFLYRLAEVHLRRGELAAAERALTTGLAIIEETGQRIDEAETYRLLAEVELAAPEGAPEKAQSWLRRALDVARRQGAKSLELRAATRLSRLWAEQGRQQEARELLAPVYSVFTEGFETPDLQEARAVLDAL